MRRMYGGLAFLLILSMAPAALPLAAQQQPINTRVPPPPPPPEEPKPEPPAPSPLPSIPVVPPPATVGIPAGTRLSVVLDAPLSTRISKDGQSVTFRTVDPLMVHDTLEIPPDTAVTATVVRARRPGAFGKPGELRVRVDRIELEGGASSPIVAHLDSADVNAQGQIKSDSNRAADLFSLASWTIQGTLLGSQIKGGKGAAIGAGAGAAIALILMASRRGPDLYLEPGTPFQVVLDETVQLPGPAVLSAQQAYERRHPSSSVNEGSSSGSTLGHEDSIPESERPKLKRRPRSSQPLASPLARTDQIPILSLLLPRCHRLP